MLLKMALFITLTAAVSHNACAFVSKTARSSKMSTSRYMTSSSNGSSTSAASFGVSRIETLQTLLTKAGAPGSQECNKPNDLQKVVLQDNTHTLQLHPHLHPIAQSKANPDHYICALRRAFADDALYESSSNAPWPIVEATLNGPGYNLLSLNSEHFMRRIAAEADNDDSTDNNEIIEIYNEHLGVGSGLVDPSFDAVYEKGSVAKLGYGASKYCLLRVGPFPDLYEEMALGHLARNDESSSLIAAEASNGKFTGFASTFRFYATLLSSLPNRDDETRDAARVCLRIPLPSIGMYDTDFQKVSQLAGLATEDDDMATAMSKMEDMYDKIKTHEEEDEQGKANMTPEQAAIEEANAILDGMVFISPEERDWSDVREDLGHIYASANLDEMAEFVDPSRQA